MVLTLWGLRLGCKVVSGFPHGVLGCCPRERSLMSGRQSVQPQRMSLRGTNLAAPVSHVSEPPGKRIFQAQSSLQMTPTPPASEAQTGETLIQSCPAEPLLDSCSTDATTLEFTFGWKRLSERNFYFHLFNTSRYCWVLRIQWQPRH